MKKYIFPLLFLAAFIVGMASHSNTIVPAVAAIGFVLSVASQRKFDGYAFFNLVPAQAYNINGKEIPFLTRAQKAMYDYLRSKSNAITQDAFNASDLVFDPISYYIRYDLTGLSGRQKILGASTQKIVGVTNINQGLLPQYYNFAFDRVVVRYANATSASAAVQSIAGYSSVSASMPAALANAELIVSVNQQIIMQTPVADFTTQASLTGGGRRDFDGGELQAPKIFPENLLIEVELNLAQSQSMPSAANNTYAVEVMFMGVQTRLR